MNSNAEWSSDWLYIHEQNEIDVMFEAGCLKYPKLWIKCSSFVSGSLDHKCHARHNFWVKNAY